jgi:hypothetical protein
LRDGQGVDDGIQISIQDAFQAMERHADPVIRDPVLGEVVGADPLAPVPRAHLRPPLLASLGLQRGLADL